jgi:hypothetical protein
MQAMNHITSQINHKALVLQGKSTSIHEAQMKLPQPHLRDVSIKLHVLRPTPQCSFASFLVAF